jgi:ABC-type lipoprotein export system ATPase subunit
MDIREQDGPAIAAARAAGGRLSVKPLADANQPGVLHTPKSRLYSSHSHPGRLIAVEGIDGSGKSTQLMLLERWLRMRGYPVHFT